MRVHERDGLERRLARFATAVERTEKAAEKIEGLVLEIKKLAEKISKKEFELEDVDFLEDAMSEIEVLTNESRIKESEWEEIERK